MVGKRVRVNVDLCCNVIQYVGNRPIRTHPVVYAEDARMRVRNRQHAYNHAMLHEWYAASSVP